MDDLIFLIRDLETQNKTLPTTALSGRLSDARNELRSLLLDEFEFMSRRLKMTHYTQGNKVGKLLAQRLKRSSEEIETPVRTPPFYQ